MEQLAAWQEHEAREAFHTYEIWEGIRRHFNYDAYNWDDYGPMKNLKYENFVKNAQFWQFVKLHRKFKGKQHMLIAHCAANFMHNKKFFIRSAFTKNAEAVTRKYIAENEDFLYNFKNWVEENLESEMRKENVLSFKSMVKPEGNLEPWLIDAIESGAVPMWLAVFFDSMTNFTAYYNVKYKDNFIWQAVHRDIKKARPFYVFDTEEAKVWFIGWLRKKGLN